MLPTQPISHPSPVVRGLVLFPQPRDLGRLPHDPGTDLGHPRELLNIFHADEIGCHTITMTHDMLKKLALAGKELDENSLDTVKIFHSDVQEAGYKLEELPTHLTHVTARTRLECAKN